MSPGSPESGLPREGQGSGKVPGGPNPSGPSPRRPRLASAQRLLAPRKPGLAGVAIPAGGDAPDPDWAAGPNSARHGE